MRILTRVAMAAGVLTVGLGLGITAATSARAEPRYHWCPGEQWSGWMGSNWNPHYCHDNHYLDNVPHTPENWNNGPYDPNWPVRPPGNYFPR